MVALTESPNLFKVDTIRRWCAEDYAIDQLKAWIYKPTLWSSPTLPPKAWMALRSDLDSVIQARIKDVPDVSLESTEDRINIRMMTMRKIDSLITGDECFSALPFLGNEPYYMITIPRASLDVVLPNDLAELAFPFLSSIRMGDSSSIEVGVKSRENVDLLRSLLNERHFVEFFERTLFPEVDSWEMSFQMCKKVRPFIEWERSNPLPVTLENVVLDPYALPEGVFLRNGFYDLEENGLHVGLLLKAGLSPYWTQPCEDYSRRYPDEISKALSMPNLHTFVF